MRAVGRNDPCPAGSGRKYNCCLVAMAEPTPTASPPQRRSVLIALGRLAWHRGLRALGRPRPEGSRPNDGRGKRDRARFCAVTLVAKDSREADAAPESPSDDADDAFQRPSARPSRRTRPALGPWAVERMGRDLLRLEPELGWELRG